MTIDLAPLQGATRLLFNIALRPLQGDRFQPTGFPNLGAASYTNAKGAACVLVESAQSMANRLELTCWDPATDSLRHGLEGLSHVTVTRKGKFLTDSVLEAHRINSPYLLEGKDRKFHDGLKQELGGLDEGPIDRQKLAEVLLKYDVSSLIHGVFLAKKELAGGRLRVTRALSAFIEAEDARLAASGGVKNDHVNPAGDTKNGFGNVPFARDEYTAQTTTLFVNLDLAQLRGYRLGDEVTRLLILLALYKVRALIDGDLRLRTACDLQPLDRNVVAVAPARFTLPTLAELEADLQRSIAACRSRMVHTTVTYEDPFKKGKEKEKDNEDEDEDEDDA
jgi:CRISPR-associated protein Csb1